MDSHAHLVTAIACRLLAAPLPPSSGGAAPEFRHLLGTALSAGCVCLPTFRAREALYWLCRLWRLGPGDEALLPAYNCGSEVDPYLHCGLSVRLYRVDRAGSIDWDDVAARVTPATRLLHLTHYFGFPQDVPVARRFCDARGLRLVEDCACALLSQEAGRSVGALADAAVFSFRKTINVSHGGALLLRDPPARLPPFSPPPIAVRLCDALRPVRRPVRALLDALGASHVPRAAPRHAPHAGSVREDMPAGYYFDERSISWSPSAGVYRRLAAHSTDAVVAARRRAYLVLRDALREMPGVQLFWPELPAGVCPPVLPFVVENRAGWLSALRCAAIPAIPWWAGYHYRFDWDAYPEACFLKDHVVAIPLTDLPTGRALGQVGQMIRAMAATMAPAS